MASLSGISNYQQFTDAGVTLASGRVYTYTAGTTTHKNAYTETTGATPHTYTADGSGGQYIALDSRGELPAPLFLATGAYDIALKRSDGTTVWTRRHEPTADEAATYDTALRADLASTASLSVGSGLVGFLDTLVHAANTVGWALRSLAGGNSILRYIPVAEWAAIAAGTTTTDLTAYYATALAAKDHFYFPKGTFLGQLDLTNKRGKTIQGAGRDVTILKNYGAAPVIKLNNTASDCKLNHFADFRIQNRDSATYTTADGIDIDGNASNENDFHTFERLEITGMRYGVHVKNRTIWNTWKDVHILSSLSDGFHLVVTENVSQQTFITCRFGSNTGYGIYLSKASGDAMSGWSFVNCTSEKNTLCGLYITGAASGIAGFTMNGCYMEENTTSVAAGATAPRKANIFIDASSCIGFVMDGCALYGAAPATTDLDWGVYISSTTVSGRVGPCRQGTYTLGWLSNTNGVIHVDPQGGGTSTLAGAGAFTSAREAFSSFTGTLTGCTTSPTGTIQYTAQLHQVTLDIPAIEATSNTTAATITGMPAAIRPTATKTAHALNKDNGTVVHGLVEIASTGTITLQNGIGGGAFTGSGTKGIRAQQITYLLD